MGISEPITNGESLVRYLKLFEHLSDVEIERVCREAIEMIEEV